MKRLAPSPEEHLEAYLSAPASKPIPLDLNLAARLNHRQLVPNEYDMKYRTSSFADYNDEEKQEYAEKYERFDRSESQRVIRVEEPFLPIPIDHLHMHDSIRVPAQCKQLCLYMADRFYGKNTLQQYPLLGELLAGVRRNRHPGEEEDEFLAEEDYTLAHALMGSRGQLTISKQGRYQWFQRFIQTQRSRMRRNHKYTVLFRDFLQTMNATERLICRSVEYDEVKRVVYTTFCLEDKWAFYLCVAFVADPATIHDDLAKHVGALQLEDMLNRFVLDKMKVSYIAHAYFTCDCEKITSKLR